MGTKKDEGEEKAVWEWEHQWPNDIEEKAVSVRRHKKQLKNIGKLRAHRNMRPNGPRRVSKCGQVK